VCHFDDDTLNLHDARFDGKTWMYDNILFNGLLQVSTSHPR
jgi:hypothetical protein